MLGALSIVTFWAFGVGVALGVGAVVAGIVAARQPDVQDNESASLKALLGMLAGVFGIVAGVIFLASALPNL
ncbi:hypothetical protein JWS13_02120 (plasmid) [Rhodococcus pseudokoreensis]|uniref:DUF4190 domain-containing protein n=2 Tax=Rhodococcus pseudokoreensis TaxID=2811421 RepID=A0A974VXS1_9NOCA|nr:hypothetical protein JWS13_02120 [Rhodococcus pseudokoreensis]